MLINRFVRFLRKPLRDKVRSLRATIGYVAGDKAVRERVRFRQTIEGQFVVPRVLNGASPFYIAYRPDSDILFGTHSELAWLSRKWVANNVENNAADLPRLYALIMNVKQVLADAVPGDFAELGVYRGNSAAVLAHYARTYGRQLYLFDTFEGFDSRDLTGGDHGRDLDFVDTSLDLAQHTVGVDSVRWIKGYFPASIPSDVVDTRFSVVHLDCDLYEPMKAGLEFFYPRLSPGGLLIIHDYANPYWEGIKQAVDELASEIPEGLVVLPDKSGTAMVRKARRV
jgi:hypothetical protein